LEVFEWHEVKEFVSFAASIIFIALHVKKEIPRKRGDSNIAMRIAGRYLERVQTLGLDT